MAWSRLVDRDLLFKCSAVDSHSHGSADFVMQEKAFGRTTDNMFPDVNKHRNCRNPGSTFRISEETDTSETSARVLGWGDRPGIEYARLRRLLH